VLPLLALSGRLARRSTIVITAAAKVNLVLEILGKRPDGYHELATVMQAVDLSDRITLADADRVEFATDSATVPADDTNLAVRAAHALADAAGVTRGVRITLAKRIPVAAGLGGGSSDAAAVLLGLNRLWRLRWPVARLEEVAVKLGMDVPFFLRGGAALATGRGERIARIAGGTVALVLVNPGFAVSTAAAYAGVTPGLYSDGARARATAAALVARRPARLATTLYNALEGVVAPAHPEIGRIRAALQAAGALGAAMSGSGPTVFGVARSFEHARQMRARLTRGSWSAWAVRGLTGAAVRLRRNGTR
jgi:4-diphosphocytidyl-2-C-methyl-D-erythritol kinase